MLSRGVGRVREFPWPRGAALTHTGNISIRSARLQVLMWKSVFRASLGLCTVVANGWVALGRPISPDLEPCMRLKHEC